jgi:hypothetical protein
MKLSSAVKDTVIVGNGGGSSLVVKLLISSVEMPLNNVAILYPCVQIPGPRYFVLGERLFTTRQSVYDKVGRLSPSHVKRRPSLHPYLYPPLGHRKPKTTVRLDSWTKGGTEYVERFLCDACLLLPQV